MAKGVNITRRRKSAPKHQAKRGRSLTELNAWMGANYDPLLEKARRNCIALTDKPTFGGIRTRKSA